MANWIPGVAVIGLICLMVLPAPGIWGVLIGGICILSIVLSVLVWLLDQMASRAAACYERWSARHMAKRRRAVHVGSGMAKKIRVKDRSGDTDRHSRA